MRRYQLYDIEADQSVGTYDTLIEATDRAATDRLTRYLVYEGQERDDADNEIVFIAERVCVWRDPLAMAA